MTDAPRLSLFLRPLALWKGVRVSLHRRIAAPFAVVLLSLSLVLTATPAQAGSSAAGIASNTWMVADLAAGGYDAYAATGYSAAAEAEAITAASATRGTTAAAGVTTGPPVKSKLGMVVNTVGMLGGLVFFLPDEWVPGGGDDETPPDAGPVITNAPSNFKILRYIVTPTSYDIEIRVDAAPHLNGIAAQQGMCSSGWVDHPQGIFQWVEGPATYGVVGARLRGNCPAGGHLTEFHPNFNFGGGPTFIWDVVNNPATLPPPPTASPTATVVTTANCRDKSGDAHARSVSTPVTSPDVEVPEIKCGDGEWLESGHHKLVTQPKDGSEPTVTPLGDYEAPPWVEEQIKRFPDCAPVGNIQCELKLFKVPTSLDSPRLDCHSVAPGAAHPCLDWFNDPEKTRNYECAFGPYALNLAKCGPYEDAFKPTPKVRSTTPKEKDTEDPIPEVKPPTITNPTPTEDGLGQCKPNKWYEVINPFWMFKATGCALKWAFVPPNGTLQAAFVGVKGSWAATSLGAWAGALGDLVGNFSSPPNVGNCEGPEFTIPMPKIADPKVSPLYSCDGITKKMAAASTMILTITLTIGGAYKCANTLLAAFGLHYKRPGGL